MEQIVRFENVSHRFGAFEALKGLSLGIRPGDLYGLLGLNGAGKTTTLRLLLGLLRHQTGTIQLFGRPRADVAIEAVARIGATIESPAFYPHLSGRTNLKLLAGLTPAGKRGSRTAEEALALVGLTHAARQMVKKYSMGMAQRLYLAQALLSRPDLLVLDEPTSNLDPQGIMEVRRLIRRLNEEEGLTVLLSSHQLGEVEGLCNRVGILNRGRMIQESTVAELFEAEECQVEIECDRLDKACQTLVEIPWCAHLERLAEDRLRVLIPRSRRSELNALLIAQGFSISEFSQQRPTLEDYFHQRIAEDAA